VTFIQIAGSGAAPLQYIASAASLSLNNSFQNFSWSPSTNSSNWGSGVTLVCPTTGYYTVFVLMNTPSVNDNSQVVMQLLSNGGLIADTGGTVEVGNFGNKGQAGVIWYGVVNAGTTFNVQMRSWQSPFFSVGGGTLAITYTPTPTYRR